MTVAPMFFMNAANELQMNNKAYRKAVKLYVWEAFRQDRPGSDITTRVFLRPGRQKIIATIRANEDGVLAGMQEAEWFLKKVGLKCLMAKKDGATIRKGDNVLRIEGRASLILSAERTLLNLLQRMSGVATKTRRMSLKTPEGMKLLATRKTLWGLLDKRAVSLGGGGTHRLHLADAILIKENHLALVSNLKSSLKRVFRHAKKVRFTEIELESPEEVREFLSRFEKLKKHLPEGNGIVVMLDNFAPGDIRKVIRSLSEAGIFVEVSGGISERNVARYNIAGISAISSGSITTQVANLDFSLQIDKKQNS